MGEKVSGKELTKAQKKCRTEDDRDRAVITVLGGIGEKLTTHLHGPAGSDCLVGLAALLAKGD